MVRTASLAVQLGPLWQHTRISHELIDVHAAQLIVDLRRKEQDLGILVQL